MFELPLLVCHDTLYEELGVEPSALADEIRDAMNEAKIEVAEERNALGAELKTLEMAVPGLAEARDQFKAALANSEKEPQVLEAARERLAQVAVKASALKPGYRDMARKIEELERKKIQINQNMMDNPEARQQYDREHPPLGLLKLEDATRDGFVENRTALLLLRKEISQFIAAQGEEVFYPSDLHRPDFSADYTPNPLLDEQQAL